MTTIKIKGMNCGHCVASVTKTLAAIGGLEDVTVNLEKSEATFTEKKPVPLADIKKAIAAIGFEVV